MDYKIIEQGTDGYAMFELNGKYGILTPFNKVLVEPIYDDIWLNLSYPYPREKQTRIKVKRNNKYGFINELGKEVILCQFDDADHYYSNDFTFVYNKIKRIETILGDKKTLFQLKLIDKNGNLLSKNMNFTCIDGIYSGECVFIGEGFILFGGTGLKKHNDNNSFQFPFESYLKNAINIDIIDNNSCILQTKTEDIQIDKKGSIKNVNKLNIWSKEWIKRKAVQVVDSMSFEIIIYENN